MNNTNRLFRREVRVPLTGRRFFAYIKTSIFISCLTTSTENSGALLLDPTVKILVLMISSVSIRTLEQFTFKTCWCQLESILCNLIKLDDLLHFDTNLEAINIKDAMVSTGVNPKKFLLSSLLRLFFDVKDNE